VASKTRIDAQTPCRQIGPNIVRPTRVLFTNRPDFFHWIVPDEPDMGNDAREERPLLTPRPRAGSGALP